MNEDCELISDYQGPLTPIKYKYNNMIYQISPKSWFNGSRPHLNKRSHKNNDQIKQLLANEDCELLSEYKNVNDFIYYKYDDKYYRVRMRSWINNNRRPHNDEFPVSFSSLNEAIKYTEYKKRSRSSSNSSSDSDDHISVMRQ